MAHGTCEMLYGILARHASTMPLIPYKDFFTRNFCVLCSRRCLTSILPPCSSVFKSFIPRFVWTQSHGTCKSAENIHYFNIHRLPLPPYSAKQPTPPLYPIHHLSLHLKPPNHQQQHKQPLRRSPPTASTLPHRPCPHSPQAPATSPPHTQSTVPARKQRV